MRAERRATPRSIASTAADSGAGRATKPGMTPMSACVEGCAKLPFTRSVSMKPKYAHPTRAPVGASSARRESVSASTPALEAVYAPMSGVWLTALSDAMFRR
jgi:hypothetical protein